MARLDIRQPPTGARDTVIADGAISGAPGRPEPNPGAADEIVSCGSMHVIRDSLSEIFSDEVDAWARHALGANGFGDYPR